MRGRVVKMLSSSESGGVLVEGAIAFTMCISFATFVVFSSLYGLLTNEAPLNNTQALSTVGSPAMRISPIGSSGMNSQYAEPIWNTDPVGASVRTDLSDMGYQAGDLCNHAALYRRGGPDCSGTLKRIKFDGDNSCAASAIWPIDCENEVQAEYADIPGCSFFVYCRFLTGSPPGGTNYKIIPGTVPRF